MGEVIDIETGVKSKSAQSEPVKPHIFAIRTGEDLLLRIAFPHDADTTGDVFDVPLTPHEMSELAVNCTMALAYRGKK